MKVVEINTARKNVKFRKDDESLKISICGVQITIIHRSFQREKPRRKTWCMNTWGYTTIHSAAKWNKKHQSSRKNEIFWHYVTRN